MELMTMENLFSRVGLNYKNMDFDVPYDVSDKNIKIKSYNHKTNKTEMKRIISLVRKRDSKVYHLVNKHGDILLKCSSAHKIFDIEKNKYFHVGDIESGKALNNNGDVIDFFVKETNEIVPIVDMEVEGNKNYFTNGILSHNTTSGGNALPYYASIRLKVSKVGVIEEGSGENKEKTSVRTRIEAVKNKTYPPFKKEECVIVFGKGIDNDAGILDELIEQDIIHKKGGWYEYEGNNIAQGLVNLKIWLAEHKDTYEQMKQVLLEKTKPEIEEQINEQNFENESMTNDEIEKEVNVEEV